jgi:hypothetical protein
VTGATNGRRGREAQGGWVWVSVLLRELNGVKSRTDVDLLFAFPRFPSLILSKAVSVSEEAQRIYSYQPSWTAIRDQIDKYVFLRDINSNNCNAGGRLREGCRPRDDLIDSTASVTSGCEVVCPAKATAERCE